MSKLSPNTLKLATDCEFYRQACAEQHGGTNGTTDEAKRYRQARADFAEAALGDLGRGARRVA